MAFTPDYGIPGDTNTNFASFGGNIGDYLGKSLNRGQVSSLNSNFGYDSNRNNYNFIQNGNIYRVMDQGNGTSSVSQIDTVANRQNALNTANFNAMAAKDDKSVTDFLTQYKTDTANAISSANTQFHIPEQTNMVNALNSRIADLSTNSSNSGGGATAGTGLGGYNSESQVGEELNTREIPQLTAATSNLNTSLGAAQQQEQIALQPDQAYEDLLKTNITTEMQGLTSTQQTEMEGIIAKLQTNTQLSVAEMQTGEAYAQAILDNATKKTVAQLGQQYQTLSPGQKLFEIGTTNGIPTAALLASLSNPSV